MMLHDVAAKIEKIKRSIEEIYRNKDRYGIREGEFQSKDCIEELVLYKRRRDVEEEEVVGLVHDSSFVIKQLMETGPRREVVSIIGMGGLGKTTLARKIYNKKEVKELFPCCSWGYVSNDYRAKELLLSLLKCLLSTSTYNGLFKKRDDEVIVSESEEELKQKVRESLKGKKYLVVLDDIWNIQVWNEVRGAFPDDNNGSRILLTSRLKEVASYTRSTPPYYLPFLNKEESWELFSNKAFRGEVCPPELMNLGRSFAESCGGLPLAIIALAGVVAKKDKSQIAWSTIRGHVNWHLAQDKAQVMDILKLSYDTLPQRLKPCFLYFGIYPEDYEIPVEELIELWIAEGFIQLKDIGTSNVPELEDVANLYLNELVDRSLVQVASRRIDGSVKTCQIHDLLLDLCISESKADKFLEICTESNSHGISNPRRLSVHQATKSYMSSNEADQSYTRSLFFFFERTQSKDRIPKKLKLARVLYIRGANLLAMPSDLKIMIHLRYLKIEKCYDATTLPSLLYNLLNLETIDIRGSDVLLPKIWKLKKLRHVRVTVGLSSGRVSRGNSKILWNLQTLSWVDLDPQLASMMENDIFPNLKQLGLRTNEYSARDLFRSLHRLRNLGTLKISGTTELPLYTDAFPSNLTNVSLEQFDEFDSSCMSALGRLPNLQILRLRQLVDTLCKPFDLDCGVGHFPQLQVFKMKDVFVKSWRLEKGAMPCLCRLVINNSHFRSGIPDELWSLPTLRQVHVVYPSNELREILQNVELKNGCKLVIS